MPGSLPSVMINLSARAADLMARAERLGDLRVVTKRVELLRTGLSDARLSSSPLLPVIEDIAERRINPTEALARLSDLTTPTQVPLEVFAEATGFFVPPPPTQGPFEGSGFFPSEVDDLLRDSLIPRWSGPPVLVQLPFGPPDRFRPMPPMQFEREPDRAARTASLERLGEATGLGTQLAGPPQGFGGAEFRGKWRAVAEDLSRRGVASMWWFRPDSDLASFYLLNETRLSSIELSGGSEDYDPLLSGLFDLIFSGQDPLFLRHRLQVQLTTDSEIFHGELRGRPPKWATDFEPVVQEPSGFGIVARLDSFGLASWLRSYLREETTTPAEPEESMWRSAAYHEGMIVGIQLLLEGHVPLDAVTQRIQNLTSWLIEVGVELFLDSLDPAAVRYYGFPSAPI